MSTGYESVLSQVGALRGAMETAIARDAQDIARLRLLALVNPALTPVYATVSVAQWAVYSVVRGAMAQVDMAFRASELSRSAQVVTRKRREAEQWLEKSQRLAEQAQMARELRGRSVDWLGDAGDLYRDTAQVCHQGLREMSRQYTNSARFCRGVADYHTAVYALLTTRLARQAAEIRSASAPFLVFFARSNTARAGLQAMLTLAQQAEAGELARDGLVSMGQQMRTELNNNDTLTHDFRADPRLAETQSSTTTP